MHGGDGRATSTAKCVGATTERIRKDYGAMHKDVEALQSRLVGVSSRERLERLEDMLEREQLGRRLAVRVLEVDLGGLLLVALDGSDPVRSK